MSEHKFTEKEEAVLDLMDSKNCLDDLVSLVGEHNPTHSMLDMVATRMDKSIRRILHQLKE